MYVWGDWVSRFHLVDRQSIAVLSQVVSDLKMAEEGGRVHSLVNTHP